MMKKKTAKKKSAFRKRRNMDIDIFFVEINYKDIDFFRFIAKASREGRL